MLNRRLFLQSSATLLISSLLSGCKNGNYDLNIAILEKSIPFQLISRIKEEIDTLGIVNLESKLTPQELYDLLSHLYQNKGQKSQIKTSQIHQENVNKKHLTTLGNYWLNSAIKNNLIEPLSSVNSLKNWATIDDLFKNLVIRNSQGNLDKNGQIWGAPYRWGYTMIAYRKDKFDSLGWQPQDWSDLWKKDIKHRFSLLNQSREVIGLVLKKLGYSYNINNPEKITHLTTELEQLHQQVKFYDSRNYLQPLILGDTWLAMGWSTDILPVVERYNNIGGIIPLSGTSLWADLWVKPKGINDQFSQEKINNWIDFCWETTSAKQISLFTNGLSPVKDSLIQEKFTSNITEEIVKKSEFIEPLSPEDLSFYQKIWQNLSTA